MPVPHLPSAAVTAGLPLEPPVPSDEVAGCIPSSSNRWSRHLGAPLTIGPPTVELLAGAPSSAPPYPVGNKEAASESDTTEKLQYVAPPALDRYFPDDDSHGPDYSLIGFSPAEEFLGPPDWQLDSVSVTTGLSGIPDESHFAPMCGPDAGIIPDPRIAVITPDPRMYHASEVNESIRREILRDVESGTVRKSLYWIHNWYGRVSLTLSPRHTSADV